MGGGGGHLCRSASRGHLPSLCDKLVSLLLVAVFIRRFLEHHVETYVPAPPMCYG
jgi:hypothetical protein